MRVFVEDGADVKAGEPLMQIDPTPFEIELRLARAMLARDEAKLEYAQSKEARGRSLLAQHYIADDEYNLLKTNLAAATATVDAGSRGGRQCAAAVGLHDDQSAGGRAIGHVEQQVGNMIHAVAQTPLMTLNVLDPVDVSFAVPRAATRAGASDAGDGDAARCARRDRRDGGAIESAAR